MEEFQSRGHGRTPGLPTGHDSLTGLLDREQLLAILCEAYRRQGATEPGRIALLFIDVDHFKSVNDSYGHAVGDRALSLIAERLTATVRPDDVVARLGGDEFVAIFENVEREAARAAAERVIASLCEPVHIGQLGLAMSASAGLAFSGTDAPNPDALLINADAAMYEAKRGGRGRGQEFNREIRDRLQRRILIETEMRTALKDGEIEVFYQPQVDLLSGRVVGVEALLRWNHAELGVISPEEFVPVAEDTGLVIPLGRFVLSAALAQFAQWQDSGREAPAAITINVSPLQVRDGGFIDFVAEELERHRVDPGVVCLELTESALMDGSDLLIETLNRLRAFGVYIAIDDFGTGHSSLARLRDLPVEVIKIDRSFIEGIGGDDADAAIVESVMSIVFAIGLHAVAEGVENAAQAEALLRLGCTIVQGYMFSPAVAGGAILELCGRRLFRTRVGPREQHASHHRRANGAGRVARRSFVEEFLDQIGVASGMGADGSR